MESVLDIRNLRQTDDRLLFKLLMENENISKMVAKYLTKSLDLREFLIEKHRKHGLNYYYGILNAFSCN